MSGKDLGPIRKHIQSFDISFHGGKVLEYAEKLGIPEEEILDFSANLNPLGSPFDYHEYNLSIEEIAKKAHEKSINYPDNRYLDFKSAAAKFTGFENVKPENIIPGNGSTEIIRLIAHCVLEKGDKIIVPYPTFGEYEAQCRIQDVEIIDVALDEVMSFSEEEIKEKEAKILFLCNPNNPDGRLWKREEILKLAKKCENAKTLLFVDEAFIELSDVKQSVADIAAENDYVFVMRSLTKAFGLPGIRLGFGIATKHIADILNVARLTWNLSPYQEMTAVALLSMEGGVNSNFLKKSREYIFEEGKFLQEKISEIWGFIPGEVNTNYILVDISQRKFGSSELVERMANHGVLVRDCISFKGLKDGYVRVAVRTREENIELINTFKIVIQEWARDFAKNELKENLKNKKGKTGENGRKTCEYYPCHFEGQDCTFCYCPFYPCNDTRTGGCFVEKTRTKELVWSCIDCYIVHLREPVDQIMEYLMKDEDTDKMIECAWNKVMIPILEQKDEKQILAICKEIKKQNEN